MAARNTFSTVYIFEQTVGRYGEVCVIKLMNDKIDEIYFDIKERVESRDDIDIIYKSYPSITVLMQGKDFILRISNRTIKVVNVRRSQGMSFEIVRPKMVHVDIFGGVDANMYIATKNLSSMHDDEYEAVTLPSFASLLTTEQIDAKFSARRKRKEDREKGVTSTVRKAPSVRSSTYSAPLAVGTPLVDMNDSELINQRVLKMEFGSDNEDERRSPKEGVSVIADESIASAMNDLSIQKVVALNKGMDEDATADGR